MEASKKLGVSREGDKLVEEEKMVEVEVEGKKGNEEEEEVEVEEEEEDPPLAESGDAGWSRSTSQWYARALATFGSASPCLEEVGWNEEQAQQLKDLAKKWASSFCSITTTPISTTITNTSSSSSSSSSSFYSSSSSSSSTSSENGPCHLVFYGRDGSGRTTLARGLLLALWKMWNLIHVKKQQKQIAPFTSTTDIHGVRRVTNGVWSEMSPTGDHSHDRQLVHAVLSEVSLTLPSTGFPVRIVLVHGLEKLADDLQWSLTDILERSGPRLRVVATVQSLSSLIEPLRSRFFPLAVPRPTPHQLFHVLEQRYSSWRTLAYPHTSSSSSSSPPTSPSTTVSLKNEEKDHTHHHSEREKEEEEEEKSAMKNIVNYSDRDAKRAMWHAQAYVTRPRRSYALQIILPYEYACVRLAHIFFVCLGESHNLGRLRGAITFAVATGASASCILDLFCAHCIQHTPPPPSTFSWGIEAQFKLISVLSEYDELLGQVQPTSAPLILEAALVRALEQCRPLCF